MDDRGCAVSRAIYNVLAIDKEGRKDLLGMYISKNEGAHFWLNVLTDLQNRGVRDILITCVDGLKGFLDTIQSVFPNTIVQLCIVHQILELRQVCRQQASKRVHEKPETCLWRCK